MSKRKNVVKRDYSHLVKSWREQVGTGVLSEQEELELVLSLKKKMMWREFYDLYLMTKHWRDLRQLVIIRDKVCVQCGSVKGLSVDHKSYKRLGAEDLEDIQLLCWLCHRNKTKRIDFAAGDFYCSQARKKVDVLNKQIFMIKL